MDAGAGFPLLGDGGVKRPTGKRPGSVDDGRERSIQHVRVQLSRQALQRRLSARRQNTEGAESRVGGRRRRDGRKDEGIFILGCGDGVIDLRWRREVDWRRPRPPQDQGSWEIPSSKQEHLHLPETGRRLCFLHCLERLQTGQQSLPVLSPSRSRQTRAVSRFPVWC